MANKLKFTCISKQLSYASTLRLSLLCLFNTGWTVYFCKVDKICTMLRNSDQKDLSLDSVVRLNSGLPIIQTNLTQIFNILLTFV